MANSIYLTTHDGLTALVSARAASKALSAALRDQGSSPDAVGYEEMKVILLGPVRREFASILPPAGLERSLKQLLKTLRELPPPEPEKLPVGLPKAETNGVTDTSSAADSAAAKETIDERDARIFQTLAFVESPGPKHTPVPLEGVRVASASPAAVLAREMLDEAQEAREDDEESLEGVLAETEVVEVEAEAEAEAEAPVEDIPETMTEAAPVAETVAETVAEPTDAVATAPATPEPVREISREALNGAILTFAQLDNVRLIAAFDAVGKSVVSRGDGFDLAALSRLSGMAMTLLGRSGVLRSYYLAHSEGQLFLFPHGGYTLMVIGNAELNLGLVFTTLQKLKEEM